MDTNIGDVGTVWEGSGAESEIVTNLPKVKDLEQCRLTYYQYYAGIGDFTSA
jgi:hypothetical protein